MSALNKLNLTNKSIYCALYKKTPPDYSWEGSFFMLTCFYIIYYTVWFCVFLSVLFLCVVKSVVKGKKKPSESLEFQGFSLVGMTGFERMNCRIVSFLNRPESLI